MKERCLRIALAGKPNSGKSSLFNQLTGLNQKTGNFPGVTVDKHAGHTRLPDGAKVEIIDLPGVYSLYPRTPDEQIVNEALVDPANPVFPDRVVLVADATNLKTCLLLLTQLIDLGLPTIMALNMVDLAGQSGQNIDVNKLSEQLQVPVVLINARNGQGIDALKKQLAEPVKVSPTRVFELDKDLATAVDEIKQRFKLTEDYRAFQFLQQYEHIRSLTTEERAFIKQVAGQHGFFYGKYQGAETVKRFSVIQDILNIVVINASDPKWKKRTYAIDHVLTHKVWGYLIFFFILFSIFQAIFTLAVYPMEMIDQGFVSLSSWLSQVLPQGPFYAMISEGIVQGMGGIVIFIPQIAILFAFITVLEESGYMARVVFLMDKTMKRVGLNGKSVVPLMSGWACSIPAIMSTRTINSWKDRVITIFVIPFMSCSARLPVFTIIVALVIPQTKLLGVIDYQGIALMALYMLGFLAAVTTALIMKFLVKTKDQGFLLLELPAYSAPRWRNVGLTIFEKTKTFVLEAGKIILAISVVLWGLASYGPEDEMARADTWVTAHAEEPLTDKEREVRVAAYKLEHSYAGKLGKLLEPAIRPLGYDWKIGIALVTSFAAREAFVGTIATIYSVGDVGDEMSIKEKLMKEKNEDGTPVFGLATGISLLIFYTLAMQCMSTLAVVKRETKSWKWPMLQLVYMTVLAYFCSFLAYNILR